VGQFPYHKPVFFLFFRRVIMTAQRSKPLTFGGLKQTRDWGVFACFERNGGRTSNGGPAGDVVRDLSRRELLILRTLTEGASNKVIALKLVITESTVKVHMKAILRKLRLQNRTQAAIWARTHLGELLENARA
jgi:DNA-binding CsgD family transcriptional regulator